MIGAALAPAPRSFSGASTSARRRWTTWQCCSATRRRGLRPTGRRSAPRRVPSTPPQPWAGACTCLEGTCLCGSSTRWVGGAAAVSGWGTRHCGAEACKFATVLAVGPPPVAHHSSWQACFAQPPPVQIHQFNDLWCLDTVSRAVQYPVHYSAWRGWSRAADWQPRPGARLWPLNHWTPMRPEPTNLPCPPPCPRLPASRTRGSGRGCLAMPRMPRSPAPATGPPWWQWAAASCCW